jgi:lipoate---protein ligase
MQFFTNVLATPAQNLAIEEAWLDMAEEGVLDTEILRLWQPTSPFVVIGRGSRASGEVNLSAAKSGRVPVFRRVSGGAAIVAGAGCLMYALLLSYRLRPHLHMLDQAHRSVMETMVAAIRPYEPRLAWEGTCDLVVDARKVSGNSLRCRREWLLYHGTLLLEMDLSLLDQFLLHPPREPEYRQKRQHTEFVTNLHLPADRLSSALANAWGAQSLDVPVPTERIERLVQERYENQAWNFER